MRKDEENYLKYLFDRYFNRSGTAATGRKLLIGAWVIEIIVASIGFITAILMSQAASQQIAQTNFTGVMTSFSAIDIQIGLVFFVAALAELTKIPFATGVYKSGKTLFKVVGLLFLVLVNILTIETILSGLDQAFAKRTYVIQQKQAELAAIELGMKAPVEDRTDQIDANKRQINSLMIQLKTNRESQTDARTVFNEQRESLLEQSVNPSERKNIVDQINILTADKNKYEEQINALAGKECQQHQGFFGGAFSTEKSQCQQMQDAREDLEKKTSEADEELAALRDEKYKLDLRSDKTNKDQIDLNTRLYQEKISNIKEIEQRIITDISRIQEDIAKLRDGISKRTDDYDQNELKVEQLREEINLLAINNNLYRVAMLFKPSELKELKRNLQILENKEIVETTSLINTKYTNDAQKVNNPDYELDIEKKILIEKRIKDTRKRIAELESNSFSAKAYYKITRDDLNRSFIYFWGVLGVIISLLGTMLAFIGLHLSDPSVAEAKIQSPNKTSLTKSIMMSLRRLLIALTKRLMKPKIVTKDVIVEKEVDKIIYKDRVVEKEVDKIIYKDRVVTEYKNVEVPVETVRKELIHVPMYTNDKSLLGSNLETDFTSEDVKKFKEWLKNNDKKDE